MNRKLAAKGWRVCSSRGAMAIEEYGDYHCVNERNHVVGPYLTNAKQLEEFGREIGALGEWERLSEAD